MDAFRELWSKGLDVELTFAGLKGWMCDEDQQVLKHLLGTQPRFQWFGSLGDDEMAKMIRGSRATIYPASGKVMGFRPLESLASWRSGHRNFLHTQRGDAQPTRPNSDE